MLVLTRKINESIMLGDGQIKITVLDVRGEHVSIGIEAPPDVKIYRSEIWDAVCQANISSTSIDDDSLLKMSLKIQKKDRQRNNK